MKLRLVPVFGIAYFLAMAIFVTYPGYVPFDRIRPFVLGLPFSLFWQVMWICGAVLVLATVFFWEANARARVDEADVEHERPPRPPTD
ncbi:MAG: hypothetical protein PVI01_03205 [Gemmatimonadales bacterium]|jgi:hypothetical protein